MQDRTRCLTRAAIAAALGTALLYVGSVTPGVKLSLLCLSALGVTFVKLSSDGRWALGCYVVTALLSLLTAPNKTAAALYTVFIGYYPLVKLRSERFEQPAKRWGLKLGVFSAALALCFLAAKYLLPAAFAQLQSAWYVMLAGAAAFFFAYDYALGILILYYLRNISGRLKQ